MFFILNELSQKLKISIGKPYAKYEALPVCFMKLDSSHHAPSLALFQEEAHSSLISCTVTHSHYFYKYIKTDIFSYCFYYFFF